MAFFKSLFGKKNATKPPPIETIVDSRTNKSININDTIMDLKKQVEMLEKKESLLEVKCENEVTNAKKFMTQKNKKKALECLKRKKLLEKNMNSLFGMKFNLETQINALEQANTSKNILDSIKNSNEILKKHKVDVDDVEDLKDDLVEQIEEMEEVSSILAEPIHNDIDEDELLEELEDLDNQEKFDQFEKDILDLPRVDNLKDITIPKQDVEVEENDEEYKKLMESMAI